MMIFGVVLLSLIAVTAFVIVRTHDVTSQVFALTFYGLLFALMFFVYSRRRMSRCRRSLLEAWRCR